MSQGTHLWDNDDASLISFFIGPVQPFIEAARSVRDLWMGSYLLSWLTFQATRPIRDLSPGAPEEAFLFPALDRVPLLELFRVEPRLHGMPRKEDLLAPCIPNKFLALVAGGRDGKGAETLAEACEQACRDAWDELAQAVHDRLVERFAAHPPLGPFLPTWDRLWKRQIASYFEIRTAVLPVRTCTADVLDKWLGTDGKPVDPDRLWTRRMELLAGLMEARRSVRHVPVYRPAGDVPQKCGLLGSYEQMGPAEWNESQRFWEGVRGVDLEGSKVGRNERLCAISLVKRFAWPAYLADALGIRVNERRFADTATVAAALWLKREPAVLDPNTVWREERQWSGQWLHWLSPDQGDEQGEPSVPRRVWQAITTKRREQGPKDPPPTYYAVLVMDGDHMGRWLRGEKCGESGRDLQTRISSALSDFAVGQVRRIVEDEHDGTLIYAGGDDVLALLPLETILECASVLHTTYGEHWPKFAGAAPATVSAGVAVVHYKEDLRFALDAARRAEKVAKGEGRDLLALSVCRRSGEHTTALLPWDQIDAWRTLVDLFRRGASDRWAYKLRGEYPTLRDLPWPAVVAETGRLIARSEDAAASALTAWSDRQIDRHYRELSRPERGKTPAEILEGFITLCQSASFLARGRDAS